MIILVSGGCGFIGSELVRQAQSLNATIRILDDMSYGKCLPLLKKWGCKYELIEGSITDRSTVQQAMQNVDYVFHMAALISVADSCDNAAEYERVNTQGTVILLEEAEKAGVKGFVFSSSSAVYGNGLPARKSENSELYPVSPYAFSKLHGERYCKWFSERSNMKIAILRYFNVFGGHQDPTRPYAACIPNFFSRALKKQNIIIYGDGLQTRDFVHVSDVALFNLYAAFEGLDGIFNVGYGSEIKIKDLAEKVIELTSPVNIEYEQARKGDVRKILSSNFKVNQTTFCYQYTLETGLAKTLEYLNTLSK